MRVRVFVLTPVVAAALEAQQSAFEGASIRVHNSPLTRIARFSPSGPRLTLEGYSLGILVMEAYGLKTWQVSFSGATSQANATWYDIVAKAADNTTPTRAEFPQMLQGLLAERFHLKVHRDTKETPVYALVVGRVGPKFKESQPDATAVSHHGVNGRNQTVNLSRTTMELLADDLGIFADRPVVDRTGLTGTYDIKLEATPEFRISRDQHPDDISIFEAVQTQLGLKLEPRTEPMEILVVNSVEKPSEN